MSATAPVVRPSADHLVGPRHHGNTEYVGHVEWHDGRAVVRPVTIPPIDDTSADTASSVPRELLTVRSLHLIEAGNAGIRSVIGDSMEPTILHGDWIVIEERRPRPGDVVAVAFENDIFPSRVYRYEHDHRTGAEWIAKDNARYSRELLDRSRSTIEGVVIEIIPRLTRDPHENHQANTLRRAEAEFLGRSADDIASIGWIPAAAARWAEVLEILPSEFVDGRLPLGLFRGRSRVSAPHVHIHEGDVLTVQQRLDTCVGDMVAKRHKATGEIAIGVLDREGLELGRGRAGDWLLRSSSNDLVLRLGSGDDVLDWQTIGLVRAITRPRATARKSRSAATLRAVRAAAEVRP